MDRTFWRVRFPVNDFILYGRASEDNPVPVFLSRTIGEERRYIHVLVCGDTDPDCIRIQIIVYKCVLE